MKYLRSTTLGCKDIRIRKSEFVTKTQFPYEKKKHGGGFFFTENCEIVELNINVLFFTEGILKLIKQKNAFNEVNFHLLFEMSKVVQCAFMN